MSRLNINVGIKLEDIEKLTKKVQSELDKVSKQVKLKIGDLDVGVLEKKITQMSSKLEKLSKEVTPKVNTGKLDDASRKIEGVITNLNSLDISIVGKGFEELQAKAKSILGTMNQLNNIKYSTDANGNLDKAIISYTNEIGQAVTETMKLREVTDENGEVIGHTWSTINRAINENIQVQKKQKEETEKALQKQQEEIAKTEESMRKLKLSLQNSLNIATKNSLVNPSLLTSLQNRLNNLNVNTPKERVEALEKAIGNLASADSRIVKLQNALSTTQDGISKLKETSKDALKIETNVEQLKKAEESIKNLKKILADVKKGNQTLDNTTISKAIGETEKKYKALSSSVKEYNDNVKKTAKETENLQSKVSAMQNKLNIGSKNGLIDPVVISDLQSKLNSLNTDAPKSEIEDLQRSISNLASSDSRIVKIQQTLTTTQTKLSKLKETSSKALAFEGNVEKLKEVESAIKELESLMARIKKGDQLINPVSVKQVTDQVNNCYKSLSDSVTDYNKKVVEAENVQKRLVNIQEKLMTAKNTGLFNSSAIEKYQRELDKLSSSSKASKEELGKLEKGVNSLGTSANQINRLENNIAKFEARIKELNKKPINLMTPEEIAELQKAETELQKLISLNQSLKNGTAFSNAKVTKNINETTRAFSNLSTNMTTATRTGTGLANTLRNIGTYMIGGSVIYTMIRAVKSGISTIKELDDSMRDLKRVTDETDYTYSKFISTANQTAIELGQTTTGVIDATTTFSQLGYSFDEASEKMAKFAMVLSNVGDMSASDSASSLVSILKAFRLETDDTERIVDVLNEAGNKFALTTGDLTEGLRIGGSSLAIANNTLEESSALIISATEILRNPNLVANGLKTISMRLRGIADENGELAPKLKEMVKSLTDVDLTDTNGEFKSTYSILNQIGKKWHELNSLEQSMLAEEIAGKNRANVFTSKICSVCTEMCIGHRSNCR